MSIKNALQFISQVRQSEQLKVRIQKLDVSDNLGSIINLAKEEGFIFSESDLQEAHKKDWTMRWLIYSSKSN